MKLSATGLILLAHSYESQAFNNNLNLNNKPWLRQAWQRQGLNSNYNNNQRSSAYGFKPKGNGYSKPNLTGSVSKNNFGFSGRYQYGQSSNPVS